MMPHTIQQFDLLGNVDVLSCWEVNRWHFSLMQTIGCCWGQPSFHCEAANYTYDSISKKNDLEKSELTAHTMA
jgi:hypothetical protein